MSHDPEMALLVCDMIAEGEMSLRAVCRIPGFPSVGTFLRWVAEDKGLQERYARATKTRAQALAEGLLDLGDEAIAASSFQTGAYRLKADNLKWALARMDQGKYGDHLKVQTTEGPKSAAEHTDAELAAIAASGKQ